VRVCAWVSAFFWVPVLLSAALLVLWVLCDLLRVRDGHQSVGSFETTKPATTAQRLFLTVICY
jgi:hypothetical protein